MQQLNFPGYDFRLKETNNQQQIFDPIRKRFVSLTPEEWVRQHLIHYLHFQKDIPFSLIACERGLKVNGMPRRFDVVVFDKFGSPVMIAECKAPSVGISEEVIFQAMQYNITLKVDYLLITNGLDHHCARVDYSKGTLNFMTEIPGFQKLNESNAK